MIFLSGASIVLPDRVVSPGTLMIDGDRIIEIAAASRPAPSASVHFDFPGHVIVPGFVDVHVHGVAGHDTLDGAEALDAIARRLPQYGVTAFCPTAIACPPPALRQMLAAVRTARTVPADGVARVLPAHLESNFINPDFRGAQPVACLRRPPRLDATPAQAGTIRNSSDEIAYDGSEILAEIERARPDVGIITLAPELPGALALIELLVTRGHRVSLGHSGASFERALAAVSAGARQATHLFNRMAPLNHREPGLAGAVLSSEEIAAELICDGHHVHPAMLRMTVAAKSPERVIAISDGTAGAALPLGSRARLGGRTLNVREDAAYLDDGTLAGSVATMDRVFRVLVEAVGLSLVDAATLCATTPARELGLQGHGALVPGGVADVVVLDRDLRVVQTYVGGALVFSTS